MESHGTPWLYEWGFTTAQTGQEKSAATPGLRWKSNWRAAQKMRRMLLNSHDRTRARDIGVHEIGRAQVSTDNNGASRVIVSPP